MDGSDSEVLLTHFQQREMEYPVFFTMERFINFIYNVPGSVVWNSCVCLFVIVILTMRASGFFADIDTEMINPLTFISLTLLCDVPYLLHIIILLINDIHRKRQGEIFFYHRKYFLDACIMWNELSIYILVLIGVNLQLVQKIALLLTALRLHRPLSYLGNLNDYILHVSIVYTLLKYLYIAAVMRVIYAVILTYIQHYDAVVPGPLEYEIHFNWFWNSFHATDKLFLPIGPEYHPENDAIRLWCIMVMISGSLTIMGIAVAALSLIIGLYIRPEEMFRRRFRLIVQDMDITNIPEPLRNKVETFYLMFWHKQKAVSESQLLPTYPPCLVSDVRTNIHFRAQQTSRMLCKLSNHFLSEIANHMETINYIPGDTIIKRNTNRCAMVYISYGDVEILSAEDDETPLLRFTRGSIINPCGLAAEVACTRAHVDLRAATFCTAHVLKTVDLWRVAAKYGRRNAQSYMIHSQIKDHLQCIKDHYKIRPHPNYKYKSNIIFLKRGLMELKEAKDSTCRPYLERSEYFLKIAECYMMRNLSSLSTTMDSDPICLRSTFPCILQPHSSLINVWNSFVAIITLFVTFNHPYYLFYIDTISMGFRFYDYVVTLIYVVDIIVHLSTGDKVEEGVPLTFARTSIRQMQSFWFTINVLSALPIFEFVGDGRFAGLNKLCKIPAVFRMLKNLEEVFVYHSHAIRFFSYCLLIVIATFLLASLNQAFLCFHFGYCLVEDFTHEPFWIPGPLNDVVESIKMRLIYSIYWAISMLSFTAHKTVSLANKVFYIKIFIWAVLELCLIFHILVQSTYSATIMAADRMRDQYHMCITTVQNFLVQNDVNPELRNRFINYLQLCWYTDKAYGITNMKKSILFDLPRHVHQDILTMQRSKFILCIPFTKYLPNEMIKHIASQARLFYVAQNEILLNTGDMSYEIYIIKQGMCEVLHPDTKQRTQLLETKGVFGDIECLLSLPAYYTVRAITTVRIFSIARKHLNKALAIPKIKDAIHHMKQLPEYQALYESRESFVKYEAPPPPPNRMFFPLPRKHETDYNYLYPFNRLGFLSVLRYVFPRFTFRPDGQYLRRYEWFRATCAIAAAFIYPLYSFLELQWPWMNLISWLLDFSAYCDILHRMLVAYFNANGILVYHPAITAAHYLRGAFLVDLVACLPLELLDYVRTTIYFEDNAYRQPSTPQYLMYNRLLQLYRVPGALKFLDECIQRKDIILMIKAFPLIISLLAVITSQVLEYSVDKWKPVTGGWRLTVMADYYQNWVIRNSDGVRYNITETPWSAMLTTFYWVVYETTTTGFNIFQPGCLNLMSTLIVGMLLSMVIITYFAVRVISIRSNVNQELASFQENVTDIVKFMNKEKLNQDLQSEVLAYYEYKWRKMGGTSKQSVLKLCDQITLRSDAILDIYGHTFNKCPLVAIGDLPLLRAIGRAVDSIYFREEMTIIEQDDIMNELYVVDYGIVQVHEPYDDNNIITILPRGSIFGNLDDSPSVLSKNKFTAKTNIQLLKIDTETFYRILQDFPSTKYRLNEIRLEKANFISSLTEESLMNKPKTSQMFKSAIDMKTKILDMKSKSAQSFFYNLMTHRKCAQVYSITVSMLCVYGDIYNAGFKDNRIALIWILYVLDVCFYMKIFKKVIMLYISDSSSNFYGDSGYWENNSRYLRDEFKYDIASCIPIEILSCLSKTPWEVFPYLRLNRLLRVITGYIYLKLYHENLYISLTMTTVVSVSIWFTLFVHTSTCIWHHIGVTQDQIQPKSSWRYTDDGKALCNNEYVCSLYFIVMTFTQNGLGDILPRQKMEVAFVSVLMILSTIIFLLYVGEFSNIIQYRSFRYYSFYSKYLELLAFLKTKRVSDNLRTIVQKYSLHLWRESRGKQVPYFLLSAPRCLRLRIMSAAYMHHFLAHPILKNCEPAFLRQLIGYLQLFIYDEDMHVVKEDQITNSMYFIHKGRVVEIIEDFDEKGNVYLEGQHFGTEQGLTNDLPYDISYKTITKSQVLTLTFDDWEYLLNHFPISANFIFKNRHPKTTVDEKMSSSKRRSEKFSIDKRDSSTFPYSFVTTPSSSKTAAQPTFLAANKSSEVPAASELFVLRSHLEEKTTSPPVSVEDTSLPHKFSATLSPVISATSVGMVSTTITTLKPATPTPSIALSLLTTPASVASTVITAIKASFSTAMSALIEPTISKIKEFKMVPVNPKETSLMSLDLIEFKESNSGTTLNMNEITKTNPSEMVIEEIIPMVPMMTAKSTSRSTISKKNTEILNVDILPILKVDSTQAVSTKIADSEPNDLFIASSEPNDATDAEETVAPTTVLSEQKIISNITLKPTKEEKEE